MQKSLVIILLSIMCFSLNAQMLYKAVKLDVGISMGEVSTHHAGFISPYIELKYNIDNHFTLGGRVEYMPFSKTDYSFLNNTYDLLYATNINSDGYIGSLLITGDYNFTTRNLRPFIGAGVGSYYAYINEKNVFRNDEENIFAPGAMFRGGFSISHFRFAVEYNLLPNNKIDINYISFKFGVELGGGKKLF